MRQRKPHVVVNSIRLKRQLHSGSFLVVEGRDDRLFFEQFVSATKCIVEVAGGRAEVAEVVEVLVQTEFRGVVGVVDGDAVYSGIRANDDLILLDHLDLDALLIRSRSLDRVIVEFGSRSKIERFCSSIREALVQAAKPIGCLRLRSSLDGMGLRFEGLRYSRFIDSVTLDIERHAFVREVKHRSGRADVECTKLMEDIEDAEAAVEDVWSVCSGDDLVGILSLGLRKVFGTNDARAVSPEVLRRSLRLGFMDSEFRESQLYAQIGAWTSRNAGFALF